jgi:hypothetical protein
MPQCDFCSHFGAADTLHLVGNYDLCKEGATRHDETLRREEACILEHPEDYVDEGPEYVTLDLPLPHRGRGPGG